MTLGRKPCQQHPDTSPPPMESLQCCCSCQRRSRTQNLRWTRTTDGYWKTLPNGNQWTTGHRSTPTHKRMCVSRLYDHSKPKSLAAKYYYCARDLRKWDQNGDDLHALLHGQMAMRYHGSQQLRPGFPSFVRLWVWGAIRIGTNKFNHISMLYVKNLSVWYRHDMLPSGWCRKSPSMDCTLVRR
jgi:hypothetical protein